MDLEHDPFAMMEYTFASHIGTHLDAPSHFVDGGRAIHEIALDRVIGGGVVLDASAAGGGEVTAAILKAGGPTPEVDGIVLIRTGWEEMMGTPEYFSHPFLGTSAVDWLIERRVKLVGIDVITPEMPEGIRSDGFGWPVHHALLGREILVIENVCNMAPLLRKRVEVMAVPMNIEGGDGAPVRLLATPTGDAELDREEIPDRAS